MPEQEPRNLEQLLEVLGSAENGAETVSVGRLVATVGYRSFGPLLLVAGVLGISPVSGVPGIPTLIAVSVVLIAAQLFMRRPCFWLPSWLTRRELKQSKLDKALRFMRPIARWVDRLLRPRLTMLTRGPFVYVIAAVCVLIAISMPPLELVPFSATIASAALTAFGLALIAHDGLVAALGIVIFVGGAAAFLFWGINIL